MVRGNCSTRETGGESDGAVECAGQYVGDSAEFFPDMSPRFGDLSRIVQAMAQAGADLPPIVQDVCPAFPDLSHIF